MSAWKDISTAPRDGTYFIGRQTRVCRYTGKLRYTKRRTWFGKTSHVPLYGWCHGRDVENIDLWQPTHWKPSPPVGGTQTVILDAARAT